MDPECENLLGLANVEVRLQLGRDLAMLPQQVQVWFQNRRQRERKGHAQAQAPSPAPASSSSPVQHSSAELMEATDDVKDDTPLSSLSSKHILAAVAPRRGITVSPTTAGKLEAGTGLRTCGELADAEPHEVAEMKVKSWPHVAELHGALWRRLRGGGGGGGEGGGGQGGSGGGGSGGG